MERTVKSGDLWALLAIGTTIGGIIVCLYLLFLPDTIGATVPNAVRSSVDLQVSMRWIQPIVGQAIVEDTLRTHRNGRDLDHAARVQWIMGRVIVELTRHRLPADRLTDEENQRIILIAQQAVQKFEGKPDQSSGWS